jgi:hypothetical protein
LRTPEIDLENDAVIFDILRGDFDVNLHTLPKPKLLEIEKGLEKMTESIKSTLDVFQKEVDGLSKKISKELDAREGKQIAKELETKEGK